MRKKIFEHIYVSVSNTSKVDVCNNEFEFSVSSVNY